MNRVIVTVAMTLAVALSACGSENGADEAAPTQAPETASSGGSVSTGACADQYSLETLQKRDYAFDGTVKAIDPATDDLPDRVTFDVKEWFKGGQGTQATRRSYAFGGVASTGAEPRAIGDRLLVAGDDDFIWECGFTQKYEDSVAADWRSAL